MGNIQQQENKQKQKAHELFLPLASNGEPTVVYPPGILMFHNRLKFGNNILQKSHQGHVFLTWHIVYYYIWFQILNMSFYIFTISC